MWDICFGSASVEIWVTEEGKTVKLVFSGDIGNLNQPILKDPAYLHEADYVVMASTYGDRSHGPRPDYVGELSAILQRTLDRGGNVVIPSFAVGRTQEMLYFIREIKNRGLVKGHGNFPVYIDSPLAIEATRIFHETDSACFDQETRELLAQGVHPILFPGLRVSVTSEESRQINSDREPKVILSASGMCEAGRIRHHLKHNLWRPESTILFVGYQAAGTLGRVLLEGAPQVKLFGETIEVQAELCQLTGMSGHADREGLCAGSKPLTQNPSGCSSTMARTKWRTGSFSCCRSGALPLVRLTTGRSGSWAQRVQSVFRRAAGRRCSAALARRGRAVLHRYSSGWSMQAAVCCGSSSTTRAEQTRTWPALPTRSMPCATSGTAEPKRESADCASFYSPAGKRCPTGLFCVRQGRRKARANIDKMHKALLVRNAKNRKIKTKNIQSVHVSGCAAKTGRKEKIRSKTRKWLDTRGFCVILR